ncbi:tumor necrosis factor receptor superfamily member 9-like [Acipenser oxyrinchus oxyrinchus]|uniref:Tumor necrosis factor receptor superfamily member 9-like n=1 Tax=Acipenser oxyrinchus oxyrinchus TaxID=40147 RepID=A0AAD8CXT0_ACIOX|nr:tumor necrosis factor receptor superfamily member 9-like [Acipenser oxyrinchus oxyrinchus]
MENLRLGFVIIFLFASAGGLQLCKQWEDGKGGEVCCKGCESGAYMDKKCGKEQSQLCRPCMQGSFNTDPTKKQCAPCRTCQGLLKEDQPCTNVTDAKCTCIEGYRCVSENCDRCVKVCQQGEEPTDTGDCQPCPAGKFNTEKNEKCKPWRTDCPPGEVLCNNGTAEKDTDCEPIPPDAEANITVVVAAVSSMFLAMAAMFGLYVVKVTRKKKEKVGAPESRTRVIQVAQAEEDACSCRYPEEEQGGWEESEELDSKLMEV